MRRLGVLTVVVIITTMVAHAHMPSYIVPCSKSAADFIQCSIAHGNDALPSILKGDKQFKIPNLLPMTFPKVEVDAGPNLKITLTNVDVLGLETVKLTNFGIDFDKQTAFLDLHTDRASLIGEYDIDGQIMVLPITGKGPVNITIEDSQFKYSFSYKLEVRDGVEYAIIQDDDNLDFTIGKAYFKLDNLFNGNQQMGDNVNTFLNENQAKVIQEFGGAVSGTISAIAKNVGGTVLGTVPFNDLFLIAWCLSVFDLGKHPIFVALDFTPFTVTNYRNLREFGH